MENTSLERNQTHNYGYYLSLLNYIFIFVSHCEKKENLLVFSFLFFSLFSLFFSLFKNLFLSFQKSFFLFSKIFFSLFKNLFLSFQKSFSCLLKSISIENFLEVLDSEFTVVFDTLNITSHIKLLLSIDDFSIAANNIPYIHILT